MKEKEGKNVIFYHSVKAKCGGEIVFEDGEVVVIHQGLDLYDEY